MAIELSELFDSRSTTVTSSGFTETRNYHIIGEGDPSEIALQLKPDLGTAHPIFPNTILTGIKVEPEEAKDVLKVEYTYEDQTQGGGGGDAARRNENGEAWVFELVSQSRQLNSVESNTTPAAGDNVTTYQKMYYADKNTGAAVLDADADMTQVGYQDGEAVAIDVYRPFSSVRVNKIYPIAEITSEYRGIIESMQNTVNAAAWMDWDIQEVLFLGATISYDYVAQTASIDYSFLTGRGRTHTWKVAKEGAAAADALVNIGIAAKPFDHIWARFPAAKNDQREIVANDPAGGMKIARYPTHVYHTRLYRTSDFTQLSLVGPE